MHNIRELELMHFDLMDKINKLIKKGRTDYNNDPELLKLCSKADAIAGSLSQLGEPGTISSYKYVDLFRGKDAKKMYEKAFGKDYTLPHKEDSITNNVHSVDVDDDGDKDIVIENKEDDMPDTEVSDERCKELRRKSIDKMKKGWGETDVMKKKKKKTAEADKENDSVDVSGIAKVLSRGPGSAYEA